MAGVIDKIDFYARYANKPLIIGVYRYLSTCQYQMINSVTLNTVTVGLNQVSFIEVVY